MTIVKRRSLKQLDDEHLDSGILVKDALKLIEKSEYYDEVINIFNIEDIKNDFIEIQGAQNLVRQLIEADEECLKIDIDSKLGNAQLHKYTDDKEIILEISSIQDKSVLLQTKTDLLYAESIYSVRSEFLSMFGIDKYLEYCQNNSYKDIIDTNIEMLNSKTVGGTKARKFRLLKTDDSKYYVRGITSVGKYKDYNLRFSLFVALIELHILTKYKGDSFFISNYSLTESDMRVVFKSTINETISRDTRIGFAIELVNDEIKRDAVKFNGIFTIFMGDKEVYIKPEETKSCILSFPHSVGIDNLKERIGNLNIVINDFVKETIDDAKKIKVLTSPDLFREHLLFKVLHSKNSEFNQLYRKQVQTILSNKVKTIFELAEVFDRVDLLIQDEHISSLDFWRYKLYQVLMDEVRNKN